MMIHDFTSIYLWIIVDILLFNVLVIPLFFFIKISKKRFYFTYKNTPGIRTLFFLILLIFCIYDQTSGDYFHYMTSIAEMKRTHEWELGLENFYNILIELTGYSNFLFRIVVWGGSLLIIHKIFQTLGVMSPLSYSLFALLLLRFFSYGRYSLGICVLMMGILYWRYKHKYIIGFLLIAISPLFHRSMYMILPVLLAFFVPFNKKTLLLTILLGFFIIYHSEYILSELLVYTTPENNIRELKYLNADREYDNSIRDLFMYYSYFLPIFVFLISFWKKMTTNRLSVFETDLYKFSIGVLFISSMCYFVDIGGASLYIRSRDLAFFPICILIVKYIVENKKSGFHIGTLALFFIVYLSDMMYYLYMFYLKTIGQGV